ncbi:sensor histidine kinase [Lederbergia panacisoli]|uniref:sensor histidine kinase n=1 Tax=Lederbergia panacisoli TaxID=1255251 RepID=UPI00214BF16A|nr:GHKL domain-containing protein [Lederbergia panacisoli]MCR2821617.1 GHKL domain-containing protein [Lederbergia panacisoli]
MQLIPIVWTILIAIVLLTTMFVQLYLYKKEQFPRLWVVITSIMQLFWLAAAFLTKTSYIALGSVLPFAALFFLLTSLREEKNKNRLMVKNYEQQMELLYELRKQRHDLQKHTSALIRANSEEYLSELHTRYTQIDGILGGESNIVAGALYAYNEQAREKGINLVYHFQQAISGLPLSEYELISFIGNILENSIDAAYDYSAATGKVGRILFSCRRQSGIWIIISKNETLPLDDNTLERIFTSRSISTKTGGHEGIGTQEIMRIVKAHDGALDFSVIRNEFTLKIKIPDVRKL